MNVYESEIMNILYKEPFVNQRILAETTGHSIGSVNKSLRQLAQEGYLDNNMQLTDKARQEIRAKAPRNAIILAAGFGMRMVPINLSTPKALIEVNGEILIERTIRQLHEVGITNITVVVGFMKESFEYLIDEFGVDLAVNSEYSKRNNLHSLAYVAGRIDNSYIIPCDIWCALNPYSRTEPYSWYMVSDKLDEDSTVRVNRKLELVTIPEKEAGNAMIGITYLTGREAQIVRENLRRMDTEGEYDDEFWERALYGGGSAAQASPDFSGKPRFQRDRMILQAKTVSASDFVEINTYEQLRELDSGSNHLQSDAIRTICEALGCTESDVTDISVLKKGMTNRSFLFSVKGAKYIMRIPGEGTDRLINRRHEAKVYGAISGRGLCDDPVYINPDNGYKITSFLENVRVCDPSSEEDLQRCMKKLRSFHEMRITVDHTFDIFGQIEFYESLWDGAPSIYRDYRRTKENVLGLRSYVEGIEHDWCLTHIDAVPDNFLFYGASDGASDEQLQLTDWEYAGMQDPHVDIAMFCIYSLYNRQECDRLIDIYFDGQCDRETRTKIYIYIAMCGLLWSNWCEYKRKLGVEFGEYSLRQYRYAKDFYRAAKEMMESSESSDSSEI
ncbi:MAG: NTP transferase domain-containing protein [Lachnospiraceae bacterium]|nr:NTP transferase domain-containing protein [Lachnospiraceae bacterium]